MTRVHSQSCLVYKQTRKNAPTLKTILHCVNFSATCIVTPMLDKLLGILHCIRPCLVIFSFYVALYEVELGSTFRNALQQLATPLHSVYHPFSNFVAMFETVSLTAHAQSFFCLFYRPLSSSLTF